MRVPRAAIATLVGVVIVGGIGWGLGFLANQPPPPSLDSATGSEYAPVTLAEFADPQDVDLAVTASVTNSIVVNTAGTVTTSSCMLGGEAKSGASTLSIDGSSIINLATSVPLWRDLAVGDEGSDVAALQLELSRLGYDVSGDGVLGRETLSAIAELRGDGRKLESLSRGSFLWLPSAQARVSECNATRGTSVEPGGVVFEIEASSPEAQITNLAPQALSGARQLSINGVLYPVDADGHIRDPEQLREFINSSDYQEAKKEGDTAHLSAVATLITPVSVSSVPPSSVVVDRSGTMCVIARGRPEAVRVVGSQLGQSFVTFARTVPSQVVVRPEADASCQ